MQSPEDVRAQLAGRFARQHRRWFVEQHLADGGWPLALALGRPTEQDLIAQPARVRDWVAAWEHHGLPPSVARVDWAERQWPRLGAQRVPERIVLDSAGHVARLIGSTAGKPKEFRSTAVSAVKVSGVTLKNVNAKGWETGLKIEDGSGWTIDRTVFHLFDGAPR